MKKKFRIITCGLPIIGCSASVLLLLLEVIWTHLPSGYGTLKGQSVRIICWQPGDKDAGWYSLALPQHRFTRITDAQGLYGFDSRGSQLAASNGNLLVSLAFAGAGDKTSVRCFHLSTAGKWQLSHVFPLPFSDQQVNLDNSKQPRTRQDSYAIVLACSPGGSYAVLAWQQDKQVNLYRMDLNSGYLQRFAQLPGDGKDIGLSLTCGEQGQVYVCDARGSQKVWGYFDSHGKRGELPVHKELLTCLNGNFAVDTSERGANLEFILSDLDHPEQAAEHYDCNALEALGRLQPDLLRLTGNCSIYDVIASANGKWLMATVSVDDKIPPLTPPTVIQHAFYFRLLWRRHQRQPVYGYSDDHSEFFPVSISGN